MTLLVTVSTSSTTTSTVIGGREPEPDAGELEVPVVFRECAVLLEHSMIQFTQTTRLQRLRLRRGTGAGPDNRDATTAWAEVRKTNDAGSEPPAFRAGDVPGADQDSKSRLDRR